MFQSRMPAAGKAALLMVVAFLAACSPRYDWREVRPDHQVNAAANAVTNTAAYWVASFPARAQSQTRTVKLVGLDLNMSMTAARVDEQSFAISEVELPPGAVPEEIRDQMLQAMLRNIAAQDAHPYVSSVARLGSGQSPLPARAVEANGHVGKEAVHLAGRFVALAASTAPSTAPARAMQIIVLGPQEELTRPAGQQAIETFMTSVRVE